MFAFLVLALKQAAHLPCRCNREEAYPQRAAEPSRMPITDTVLHRRSTTATLPLRQGKCCCDAPEPRPAVSPMWPASTGQEPPRSPGPAPAVSTHSPREASTSSTSPPPRGLSGWCVAPLEKLAELGLRQNERARGGCLSTECREWLHQPYPRSAGRPLRSVRNDRRHHTPLGNPRHWPPALSPGGRGTTRRGIRRCRPRQSGGQRRGPGQGCTPADRRPRSPPTPDRANRHARPSPSVVLQLPPLQQGVQVTTLIIRQSTRRFSGIAPPPKSTQSATNFNPTAQVGCICSSQSFSQTLPACPPPRFVKETVTCHPPAKALS
ncbi:hypothetical protein C9F11_46665 (plasmid) [Streptomyces sp. YIM 121038]|nr:hypothetical protein C9F11_46665 [Streptomyces sp. YIM 121038]